MSDQPLLVRTPEAANAPLKTIRPTIAFPHVPIDPATLARVRDGLMALP